MCVCVCLWGGGGGGVGREYIEEAGNFLQKRVTVYNQKIRGPQTRMLKVNEHFDNCAKNILPKYTIFLFYRFTQKEKHCDG